MGVLSCYIEQQLAGDYVNQRSHHWGEPSYSIVIVSTWRRYDKDIRPFGGNPVQIATRKIRENFLADPILSDTLKLETVTISRYLAISYSIHSDITLPEKIHLATFHVLLF